MLKIKMEQSGEEHPNWYREFEKGEGKSFAQKIKAHFDLRILRRSVL